MSRSGARAFDRSVRGLVLLLVWTSTAWADISTALPKAGAAPAEYTAEELQARFDDRQRVLFYRIAFVTGQAELKAESEPTLAEIARCWKARRRRKLYDVTERLVIEGHTDALGAAEWNQRLSEARAAAVRAWLLAHGADLPESLILAVGVGKERPIADNRTAEGRAKNRRIELVIQLDGK